MYLEAFRFPIEREEELIEAQMIKNGGTTFGYIDNTYPCGIFSAKELREINFENITILYGGNGSGKSTGLNLIAEKLGLNRQSPFNKGELMELYTSACTYKAENIPEGSSIITSDDVFDYMLAIRSNNEEITEEKEKAREYWNELRSGRINREIKILENFDEYKKSVIARNKNISRRKFIRRVAGQELALQSNGETALEYFNARLKSDSLYLLDEPENSLSPKLQLNLVDILKTVSRSCGVQLVIATHSPFILSLSGARIYDLDETPVDIKNWWELENIRTYYEFFRKNEDKF